MVIRKAGEEIPNAKLPIIPNGLPLVKIFINELFFIPPVIFLEIIFPISMLFLYLSSKGIDFHSVENKV